MASYVLVLQPPAGKALQVVEINLSHGQSDRITGVEVKVRPSIHPNYHRTVQQVLDHLGFQRPLRSLSSPHARRHTTRLMSRLEETIAGQILVEEYRGEKLVRTGILKNGEIVWPE